uniref:ribosomal protein S3 n=1 Tax=Paraisaria heteropoda TaxID=2651841 RepID=UPI0026E19761|nr:ribosomal protein S3 [Paraisaria heteropoda]WJR82518.1 ribosomal protein S3 [Paraisaria heteropoda]
MKIFNNNLKNNSKTIALRKKLGSIGKIKYFPSFSKEWKNIIYSYNKNNLKNIPINIVNINKIIKSYFNLYFKKKKFVKFKKFIRLKRRRKILRRIYVSNAEIKHTNNKAIITLYIVNREKKILNKKYLKINKNVSKSLIKCCFLLYKNNIAKIFNKHKYKYASISAPTVAAKATNKILQLSYTKKSFLNSKLEYLKKIIILKNFYLEKILGIIKRKYEKRYLKYLRKYDLIYSLNQYKFNKQILLPILSKILNKIIGKKIEYNLINLKSIAYNTDIFTNILALKLKRKKMRLMRNMYSLLNRANLPIINIIKERDLRKKNVDLGMYKYKDLKIISNLNQNNLDELLSYLSKTKEIHSTIYNSIGYKNIGGVRLEVKGRLTRRYRADRSIYSVKWKGGLKNVDSSFKGLSSVLFRGNFKSNVSYSLFNSKRRIGAFAVKGWISGKSYSTMAYSPRDLDTRMNPWALSGFADPHTSLCSM